jgi:hypothetical protein
MANQIILNEGRPGAIAAEAIEAGDVLLWNATRQFKIADATASYAMVAVTNAATGTRLAAENRKGMEVRAKVDGTSDVAIGAELELAAGSLVLKTTGVAVAVALEAHAADAIALKKVMLL